MLQEEEFLNRITSAVPSERQLMWQNLEFTAFFHYGMNSFLDQEWGSGKEDLAIFHPKRLDTDGWCEALQSAGIKACILTCKHHDGFCLWDTKYTEYCVRNTPYQEDILAKLAKSCQKYKLKLGVYLSPWDRHEQTYGQGRAYDDYFCNQLTELLTNYGEIYTVWLDGACGEGPNGKKQVYDFERYFALVRRLSPSTVLSICGPDVRWCGNEAGHCRETEWSVVPEEVFSQEAIAGHSQQEDGDAFRERKISAEDAVLSSRELLLASKGCIWYPAEVDVSIRPGWFYHQAEDDKVRSLDQLFQIYLNAVGGNALLLLNIPPHPDGYIARPDRDRLKELGDLIQKTFAQDLAKDCKIAIDPGQAEDGILNLLSAEGTYFSTKAFAAASVQITLTWKEEKKISYVVLKEHIPCGQRVEEFIIEARIGNDYHAIGKGTTIGYQKICPITDVRTNALRIHFIKYRKNIILERIAVY